MRQKENQRELAESKARDRELDRLYAKIYEDQAFGHLSEERFQQLAAKCDEEQSILRLHIHSLDKVVQEVQQHKVNIDGFLSLVRQHASFTEVTPQILGDIIDKIVVCHRQKEQGVVTQKVEIYCRIIGKVDVPALDQTQVDLFFQRLGR